MFRRSMNRASTSSAHPAANATTTPATALKPPFPTPPHAASSRSIDQSPVHLYWAAMQSDRRPPRRFLLATAVGLLCALTGFAAEAARVPWYVDVHPAPLGKRPSMEQVGRTSCRERVCQSVWLPVVAVLFKTKNQ